MFFKSSILLMKGLVFMLILNILFVPPTKIYAESTDTSDGTGSLEIVNNIIAPDGWENSSGMAYEITFTSKDGFSKDEEIFACDYTKKDNYYDNDYYKDRANQISFVKQSDGLSETGFTLGVDDKGTITIKNIPAGYSYSIKIYPTNQTTASGYNVKAENASGIIKAGNKQVVTFNNTLKLFTWIFDKRFHGSYSGETFYIRIKFEHFGSKEAITPNLNIDGVNRNDLWKKDTEQNDGGNPIKAYIPIKDGSHVVISDIPFGAGYFWEEQNDKKVPCTGRPGSDYYYYNLKYVWDAGHPETDGSFWDSSTSCLTGSQFWNEENKRVTILNNYRTVSSLSVSKKLVNTDPRYDNQNFKFKITLSDNGGDCSGEYKYTGSKDGTLNLKKDGNTDNYVGYIELKKDEKIKIDGLPALAQYKVEELTKGYKVKASGESGIINKSEAVFTNEKTYSLPVTGKKGNGMFFFAGTGIMLLSALSLFLYVKAKAKK